MANVKGTGTEKVKIYTAKTPAELYDLIGLDAKDAAEVEFKFQLKKKIRETVKARKLTHEQAAKLSGTSRTRMTAILNGNISGVSSDLLLRILYSLGLEAKVTFKPVRPHRVSL
ncbi:MAG: helix-turn-helix domain-containing protein [Pyrinomonadaceae bacterium]